MMHLLFRKRKILALFLTFLMCFQLLPISMVWALTSGPSQPELQQFQPAGVTDMVDLFSGDFNYNIPLFELPGPNGGYPFSLGYKSSVGMDEEASWVGLGFTLNPGAINRQMRGLPDEFKGDPVYTKTAIEPSVTVGLGAGAGVEIFGGDNFSLGVGFSVSQNNYSGFSYGIDASAGFQQSIGSSLNGGIGLNLSLNSKEGIGVSPSLSLDSEMGMTGLGMDYNSKQGLQNISLTHSMKTIKFNDLRFANKWGASLSLAHPSYIPQVSMPMRNANISATFKPGGSWWGIFGAAYIRGFYNEQWLKNNRKRVRSNAYGYLNYQYADRKNDLLDFNREKDGQVLKESPNLSIPSLTYDIYTVTGQGMAAMYRPMRNDYGMVNDPETISLSTGGAVGVDVAPLASHVGVNLDINHSRSVSGFWNDNNTIRSRSAFQGRSLNRAYEPWYFKGHGEPSVEKWSTASNIGGDDAVRLQLGGSRRVPKVNSTLENRKWRKSIPSNTSVNSDRKPRSQPIQPITNEQLVKGRNEMIPHFQVTYKNRAGADRKLDRSTLPGHHIAGYTALNANGLRYNYALPAYNLKQEEASFSVRKQSGQTSRVNVGTNRGSDPVYQYRGTKKFLKKTELPAYAHSYMLTSIIGADYVDVTGDGVSADDLGYWVKFTYQQTSDKASPYKWRDPYSKAHFQEGWLTDPRDDKGYYTYGEKEIWYLRQAETKSHIATFDISARDDGRGVAAKLQDSNNKGARLYALDAIKLFTRSAGSSYLIRTIRFDYDYSLCPGVFNNGDGGGKLTLKKLWFEHGNSQRGRLNPYVFSYHRKNPAYDFSAYDRWGNYKPYPSTKPRQNRDFPYVDQNPANKSELDDNVAVWSLREIALPSGGKITVDYETDDYAYVQHKEAMQMTSVVDPYTTASGSLKNKFQLSKNNMKIRFPLEQALPGSLPTAGHRAEVLKYLDDDRQQLYFKALINLRTPSENFHEYISGYVDVDFAAAMGLEKDAGGNYAYGYFHVKSEEGFHPFSLRTFQHLRTNQPELANSGRRLEQTNSNSKRVKQIRSLGGLGAQIRQMFSGFYNYCFDKGWGREVVADRSWIRLKSPDKIKYGGGLRVRQVTMTDEWADDEEGVYGQVYEYTTEEKGQIISSGVAAYEPLIGGDEIPLRYSKKYVQNIPLRSDNNLYFEYPINETYYPGPQVGYSKVTVSSLASAYAQGKEVKNITLSDGKPLFPSGPSVSYGTTGMTVHEFYTAKDFPVITNETDKANKPFKLSVVVPFLGNISISKLASSQGYSIITNDMHGKPKMVSNYRQDREGGLEPDPISWVKYNYHGRKSVYQKENVNTLSNVFKDNGDGTLSIASSTEQSNNALLKYTLGQETEMFMDLRHSEDNAWTGGATVNVDIVYIPILFAIIPIPVTTVWPRVGKTKTELNTAVTNKVIFKSGILESIEAYDGGSLVKTQNLKWDKVTGEVVLSTTTNNYDAPIYSYNLPAYQRYQGMGAAYQNIGFTFAINNVKVNPFRSTLYNFSTPSVNANYLQGGDELLLYDVNGELTAPLARAVYSGDEENQRILFSDTALTDTEYKCVIVRSGFRNQLSSSVSTISALKDPSIDQGTKTYNKTISIPKTY